MLISGNLVCTMHLPESQTIQVDPARDTYIIQHRGKLRRPARRAFRRAMQRQARAHEQDGLALWRRGNTFTLTHLDKRPRGASWKRQ